MFFPIAYGKENKDKTPKKRYNNPLTVWIRDEVEGFMLIDKLISGPFTIIFGFIRHWYLLIMVPAFFAAAYFILVLADTGVGRDLQNFIVPKVEQMSLNVKRCGKLIRQPTEYVSCLGSVEEKP